MWCVIRQWMTVRFDKFLKMINTYNWGAAGAAVPQGGKQMEESKRWKINMFEPCMCELINNLMYSNLISVVNFALAHSKFDQITPNFAHALLTSIICLSIFFVWREWADVSQFSSELTSEYLFDLTTGTAMAVPNTDKGFACGIFCTPHWQEAGTWTEGGSDNTFVGQNSPFFLFFSLLFSLSIFNFGHRYE